MRPIWLIPLVFSLSLLISLAACSHTARLSDHLYYRLSTNPTTLDPALVVDVTGGHITAKLFNGLVRLDENLAAVPDLAESWSVSRDGLQYKFVLRKDVTFSNNRKVTAHDFKYSFKRILDPKTRSSNTWVLEKIAGARAFMSGESSEVSGIRVIDEHTLELALEKPFSPFISLLTMTAAYVVPEEEVTKRGLDFGSKPVGTGPFVLKEWLSHRELRLIKRDGYFGGDARIKGIVYRVIPEDLTALTEFEVGNLDLITIPGAEIRRFRNEQKWKALIDTVTGINTYYIGMNCSRAPFNKITVRKAMNIAIDRKKLLDTFYEKRGRLAAGPVPFMLRRWEASPPYEYDPEKAREIIRQEGLTGTAVDFYITADQEVVDMAEFIQSYIKRTGLMVNIKQLEWSAFKEALAKGEADMFWISWWADYPDPEDFLFPLFHSSNRGPAGNRTWYRNPEVDRLIELGQAAQNEQDRNRYYERAERLIVEEAPWVFFWHKTDFILKQSWVKNYKPYPIYSMDKGLDVGFK